VHVKVVTGEHHSTVVLAPVFIDGKGPYAFAVDTGATRSVVFPRLADKLGLRPAGKAQPGEGVGCRLTGTPVRVPRWQVGKVALPAETVVRIGSAGGAGISASGLGGLLGSDELAHFATVSIDYRSQVLRLGG
jgi:hypothetical protein